MRNSHPHSTVLRRNTMPLIPVCPPETEPVCCCCGNTDVPIAWTPFFVDWIKLRSSLPCPLWGYESEHSCAHPPPYARCACTGIISECVGRMRSFSHQARFLLTELKTRGGLPSYIWFQVVGDYIPGMIVYMLIGLKSKQSCTNLRNTP